MKHATCPLKYANTTPAPKTTPTQNSGKSVTFTLAGALLALLQIIANKLPKSLQKC